jgi:hypothetical protein
VGVVVVTEEAVATAVAGMEVVERSRNVTSATAADILPGTAVKEASVTDAMREVIWPGTVPMTARAVVGIVVIGMDPPVITVKKLATFQGIVPTVVRVVEELCAIGAISPVTSVVSAPHPLEVLKKM